MLRRVHGKSIISLINIRKIIVRFSFLHFRIHREEISSLLLQTQHDNRNDRDDDDDFREHTFNATASDKSANYKTAHNVREGKRGSDAREAHRDRCK